MIGHMLPYVDYKYFFYISCTNYAKIYLHFPNSYSKNALKTNK